MGEHQRPRARRVAATVGDHAPASDYADSFTVSGPEGRTAEQWARATFEGAARPVRWVLVLGWRVVLGLRLGPRPSPDHVLGWQIIDNSPDEIRLELRSPATTARLVVHVDGARVQLTTLVDHERRRSRPLWAVLAPVHRQFVPYLLTRAARRQ